MSATATQVIIGRESSTTVMVCDNTPPIQNLNDQTCLYQLIIEFHTVIESFSTGFSKAIYCWGIRSGTQKSL